ncbi:uncharacterized protein LOC133197052 [Saccostrea echinata]|uniref:uncharacterized protein LOC133197052 n=1 Tax=Saccostrea echinata TaxID=191078 RepID=UPI002A811523|nr:uncharacterized protein LOC133197052 [Saccostrea echinata]
MKRKLKNGDIIITSKNELETAIRQECKNIPVDYIQSLYKPIPRRIQRHREYSEPAKQHQTCRTGQVSEISEEDGSLSCSWNSFDSPEPSDSYIDEIIGENARHLRKGRKGHLNMLKVKQTAAHDGYPHDNSQKLEWKLKSDGGNQTLK